MMPSARTPTTSNRWTTALKRKRLGWRNEVGEADQRRPEEAEQADQRAADLDDPLAKLAGEADQAAALFRVHPHRLVGFGDLVEQALDFLARADDLGVAVADGAVDEPGADRVHSLDAAKVDGQRVGLAIRSRGRCFAARAMVIAPAIR